jgi:hypothetical protein
MYDSDRKYLSRFALDPELEYGGEDLRATDYSVYAAYDDDLDSVCIDDLDPEKPILEDDLPFEE